VQDLFKEIKPCSLNRNSWQEHKTATEKEQLNYRGINTGENKLDEITRGCG